MAVGEVDRAHLAVQALHLERGVERAGAGVHGRDLLALHAADGAEAAAEVDVVAVHVDRADEPVHVRVPRQQRAGRQVDRRRVVARHLTGAGRGTRGAERRELPADVGGGAADGDRRDAAVRLPRGRRRRADDGGLRGSGERRPRRCGNGRLQQGRPTHSHCLLGAFPRAYGVADACQVLDTHAAFPHPARGDSTADFRADPNAVGARASDTMSRGPQTPQSAYRRLCTARSTRSA